MNTKTLLEKGMKKFDKEIARILEEGSIGTSSEEVVAVGTWRPLAIKEALKSFIRTLVTDIVSDAFEEADKIIGEDEVLEENCYFGIAKAIDGGEGLKNLYDHRNQLRSELHKEMTKKQKEIIDLLRKV